MKKKSAEDKFRLMVRTFYGHFGQELTDEREKKVDEDAEEIGVTLIFNSAAIQVMVALIKLCLKGI